MSLIPTYPVLSDVTHRSRPAVARLLDLGLDTSNRSGILLGDGLLHLQVLHAVLTHELLWDLGDKRDRDRNTVECRKDKQNDVDTEHNREPLGEERWQDNTDAQRAQ